MPPAKKKKPAAKRKPVKKPLASGQVKAGTRYLSRRQFEKLNPFGEWDTYLRFIARRTGLSKDQVRTMASGVEPARFHELLQASKKKLTQAEQKYARQIAAGFRKAGHGDMAKYAKLFVLAGRLSGYDPRFIAAFAAQESAWGKATPGNAPFNFWGWSVYTGNQSSAVASPFQKPKSAFTYFGKSLKKRYGGAKTAFDPVWDPYAADPAHEQKIASILRTYFGGNPYDIRYG